MLFEQLRVWRDPIPRLGPENMAVDELLIAEGQSAPILRLYEWEGRWASFGYFQSLAEVQRVFGEEVRYVRRWTAGGLVDHREDITYSLIIPSGEKAARLRGGEGYREIHDALASALRKSGVICKLIAEDSPNDSAACFEKPVCWDVVGEQGKLAGAGQRRGKWGVLHQGSVLGGGLDFLASELAEEVEDFEWEPRGLAELTEKYASARWLERR